MKQYTLDIPASAESVGTSDGTIEGELLDIDDLVGIAEKETAEKEEAREAKLATEILAAEPEYDGQPMRKITAASWELLRLTGCKIIVGDTSQVLEDVASFVLLHMEKTRQQARRVFFEKGKTAFREFVFDWIDEDPDTESKLAEASQAISGMLERYRTTFTKDEGAGGKRRGEDRRNGGHGSRIG